MIVCPGVQLVKGASARIVLARSDLEIDLVHVFKLLYLFYMITQAGASHATYRITYSNMAEVTVSDESCKKLQKERATAMLRDKLNADKIKLWLPPYTINTGEGEIPQALIDQYANDLALPATEVADCLEDLRCHALEKLAAKKLFDEQGLATVKCKLTGDMPTEVQKNFSLELSLKENGGKLKQLIAEKSHMERDRLKVICSGHVIEDMGTLHEQNIKNCSQILALVLSASEAEARKQEDQAATLARIREGAEMLASKEDGGKDDTENHYIQIVDQTGKPLNMPNEERKALVLAMTLHEKGKTVLKKKEYGDALLLLLEADKEFKKCRADILSLVDNYALLCLDIVWCYLRLQNVTHLPDAESRLKTCDDCFRKSYGPNLERLALVKGGTGIEKALFMRLHLLQGILAFHQQKNAEAASLLNRAERELQSLVVKEEDMLEVMQMGFTQQEARLSLRLTEGNIQLAVAHIMRRREEKEEMEAKVKAEKRERRLQKEFGKTANNSNLHIGHYDSLVSMGYPKGGAAEALKQTNNDIVQALQALNDNPHLLNLPGPEKSDFKVTDDMISQVCAMGFDEESARAALTKFEDVSRAIEELLQVGGVAPPPWLEALQAHPSTSSGAEASSEKPAEKSPVEKEQENKLIDDIIKDLPRDEEEHLDLTLEEEGALLAEYLSYLQALQSP